MPLKHKLLNNFGTNRDILKNFFVVDHHNYGNYNLTKASADFKHNPKKLGRRQKISKKKFASKN